MTPMKNAEKNNKDGYPVKSIIAALIVGAVLLALAFAYLK